MPRALPGMLALGCNAAIEVFEPRNIVFLHALFYRDATSNVTD